MAVALIAAMVVVFAIVALSGGSSTSVIKETAARKPYTSSSGAMRENAVMRTSQRDMDVEPYIGGVADGGEMEEFDDSLVSRDLPDEEDVLSEADQMLDEALNALSPREGIRQLEERLASAPPETDVSKLHAAMALLHMYLDPPEPAAAMDLLATAEQEAQTPEEKHYADFVEAKVLQARGDKAGAMDRLRLSLESNKAVTLSSLEMRVMLGNLAWEAGDLEAAEQAYDTVLDQALAAAPRLGRRALAVYRQACLRQTRLYRATGRSVEAERLVRAMRGRLPADR